jgi:Rrf2 family nitric oxide-sensitive transcriptional repressor
LEKTVRLQRDVEYSLISLTALGEGRGLMSAAELSRRFAIPRSLLAKVLQRLQKGGLIEAERGQQGGYRLLRPLEAITIQEVIETLRGSERLAPCLEGQPCPQLDSCSIRNGVSSLQGLFEELLSSLTLAQLSALPAGPGRGMELGDSLSEPGPVKLAAGAEA